MNVSTEVEEASPPEKKKKYPYLGMSRGQNGFIVLFLSPNSGPIVGHSVHSCEPSKGELKWAEENFERMPPGSTVTLTQEN